MENRATRPEAADAKAVALQAFEERKKTAPAPIDNSKLYAGSPMTYYCRYCKHVSEVLPECHDERPSHVCDECQVLSANGWMSK